MYDFDWSSIIPSMPYLLAGLVITLKITVTAIVIGIVWGTILAVMRLSSFLPLAWFAKTYYKGFPEQSTPVFNFCLFINERQGIRLRYYKRSC